MKKILLTGSNGFIGKNIKESFLSKKYEIVCPGSKELNLLDKHCVEEFFVSHPFFDVVLHSAAKPGHRNAKDPNNLFFCNMKMFENLIKFEKHFDKFINFGSGAVYDTEKEIKDAEEIAMFESPGNKEHDFCKYLQGKRIESMNLEKKRNKFIDLNIFGIFGKYEDWEIRFISNAICKIVFNMPITIKQNRVFSYIYVEDLFGILEYFIENDAKFSSYNVVSDEKYSLLELAEIIKKVSNKNVPIKIAKNGMGFEYSGLNARLKKEIKNLNFTKVEESIFRLYNYYIQKKDTIDKSLLLEDK